LLISIESRLCTVFTLRRYTLQTNVCKATAGMFQPQQEITRTGGGVRGSSSYAWLVLASQGQKNEVKFTYNREVCFVACLDDSRHEPDDMAG
jgi:hypothetical protein